MQQARIRYAASTKAPPARTTLTSGFNTRQSHFKVYLRSEQKTPSQPSDTIATDEHKEAPEDPVRHTEGTPAASMTTTCHVTPPSLREAGASLPEPLDKTRENCVTNYEMRPQRRNAGLGFTSTWVDQDDTGDYDPSSERRKLIPRRHRVRQLSAHCASMRSEGTEADILKHAPASQSRLGLHVTLRLDAENHKTKLKDILNSAPTQAAIEYDPFVKTWQLKKARTGRSRRSSKPVHVQDTRPNDCAHLPDDLTGYPIARGCWGCLGLGIAFAESCSLLQDEYGYPCRNCRDEGEYCTPIVSPKCKQQCEGCKQRKKLCSYTYTTDHERPCEECAAEEYQCAAGPLVEEVKPRIRYDRSPADLKIIAAALAQTERQWQPRARPAKKSSNSSSKIVTEEPVSVGDSYSAAGYKPTDVEEDVGNIGSSPPPQQIEPSPSGIVHLQTGSTLKKQSPVTMPKSNLSAKGGPENTSTPKKRIFIDLTEPSTPKKQRVESRHPHTSPTTLTRPPQSIDKSHIKSIKTGFCHPVTFNHQPTPTSTSNRPRPCNFCDGTSFPLLSLAPRTVQVLDLPNGRGYTEIAGGYASRGHMPTRMCTECTMQRMKILVCPSHVLRPLRTSKEDADFEGALNALFANSPRRADKWCSLCPALAAYECQAEGCMDKVGELCGGCGLMVCETCRVDLVKKYGGDLQVMLRRLRNEPMEVRPLGLRADAEFLKQDGLLMRFVMGNLGA